MPQKTRREKERAAQRRETGQYKRPIVPAPIEMPAPDNSLGVTTTLPTASTRKSSNAVAMPTRAGADFNYSYVFADLRRIAVLAILCFGIMIVLALVLKA
jgi:hypothetical protein